MGSIVLYSYYRSSASFRVRIALNLKQIARDIEFWIREDERAIKLADLISSGTSKKELINIQASIVLGFFLITMERKKLLKHIGCMMKQEICLFLMIL